MFDTRLIVTFKRNNSVLLYLVIDLLATIQNVWFSRYQQRRVLINFPLSGDDG